MTNNTNMERIKVEYKKEMESFSSDAMKWCFDNKYRERLSEDCQESWKLFEECFDEGKYELAYKVFESFTDLCMKVQRSGADYLVARLEATK